MKKIINIVFSLLVVLLLPFFFSVRAQTDTTTPAPTDVPARENLGQPFCFTATTPYAGSGHIALLQVKSSDVSIASSLGDQDVYVVECISVSADKTVCTTANPVSDSTLFATSPAQDLSNIGYNFSELTYQDGTIIGNATLPPTPVPASSVVTQPLVWGDSTKSSHDRVWLGYYFLPPPPPTPAAGLGGQQQATMPLNFDAAAKRCVPISWDPSGRVFDSLSLEPVNGVSVALSRKQADGSFKQVNPFDIAVTGGGTFVNPFLTVDDGSFSFFVADGTYRLMPTNAGYTFPSAATLNPNYSQAYFDIYPALSAGALDIVESGAPQHRDIPVDSKSTPTVTPLKLLDIIYQADHVGNAYVDGRTSHPLSVISVYSTVPDPANSGKRIRYRLIDTVTADKLGKFSLKEDQMDFDQSKGEAFGEIEIAKANIFTYDISKATVIKTFDPLPSYLQGTAYNATGVALPDTTVGLYLSFSNKPYYQTTTDAKGYFQIPSDFIPTMPYNIKYTGAGTSISVTTSKFLSDNASYIESNKLNLFSPNYSDPKVNESIKKSLANVSGSKNGSLGGTSGSNSGTGNNNTATNSPATQKNLVIAGIVLFIIILLGVAGLLVFYMMKKNQNQTPEM